MSPSPIRTKPISELLGEHFFVPDYQRGFRWRPKEVHALLDDLEQFQRSAAGGDYYCLQPVVVSRLPDERAWELVDGQQRLTTIYLVLSYFSRIFPGLLPRRYTLEYQTRDGSAAFLDAPCADKAKANIDFYHIDQAQQAIVSWFEGPRSGGRPRRDPTIAMYLFQCLTNPDITRPTVRVIWYELAKAQLPREVFLRLNVGRIPLTSAELIRAVLLSGDSPDAAADGRRAEERPQIAQDWDRVERRLQGPSFWYFLQSSREPPPARIEYLFDVFVMQLGGDSEILADDELVTFLRFKEYTDANGRSPQRAWRDVWRVFQTLEEWFEDPVLYHLVGFLVATAPRGHVRSDAATRAAGAAVLVDLLQQRVGRTRPEFDAALRALAWGRFTGDPAAVAAAHATMPSATLRAEVSERFAALTYGKDNEAVRRALLLFNVAGVLDGCNEEEEPAQRFQFDRYKDEKWDIEHVRSVTEYIPNSPAGRTQWLQKAREFVETGVGFVAPDPGRPETLLQDIDSLLMTPSPDKSKFDDLFRRVRERSGEADARQGDNGLANLALLDQETNRGYKNAVFPLKRTSILRLDQAGKFLPPATRNVFLKYYNPAASQLLLWDAADQKAYGEAIIRVLVDFFSPLTNDGGT